MSAPAATEPVVVPAPDAARDLAAPDLAVPAASVPAAAVPAARDRRDWLQVELDQRLSGSGLPLADLGRDHEALRHALAEASSGGKRFRPRLVATLHAALTGRDLDEPPPAAVAAVAAAVELLHTAFVVHDDVLDGDDVRRGRPSAPGWFRGRALAAGADQTGAAVYAQAGAVLTGDLALVAALKSVATCGAPSDTVARLLDLFDRALHVSAAGELADVRFSLGLEHPTLGEAVTMAEHKTAVYSFELPMQCAAVLAGADEATVRGLGVIGRQIGVAFQLLDDLQGVFGDPGRTGKDTLGDLREGKRTPLVVHASTTPAWPRIAPHLGDPQLSEAGADLVRQALEDGGSRRYVQHLAAGYLSAALGQAADLGLPDDLFAWLDALTEQLRGAA